jgi:hypothetical protein
MGYSLVVIDIVVAVVNDILVVIRCYSMAHPHFASFPDFIGLDRSVIMPEMGSTVRVFP